jgi:copper chaperone CopZ
VRVALSKVDGVASVEVTLKRGVAVIRLTEGNAVKLSELRRIVKDAGYTSQEAAVTAIGRIAARNGATHLSVEKTQEVFHLEAHAEAPDVLREVARWQDSLVEVTGIVLSPAAGATTPSTLRARAISVSR